MEIQALKPAVFLDRDGTINEQMGYINHISRFHLLPGAGAAIRALNTTGVPVVVVTNQSGLARGYFPEELLTEVHAEMQRLLAAEGAHIDGLYVCPHHPEAKQEKYRTTCDCRKPKPGMLLQAAREMHLDLGQSFVVGDRWSDLRCAAAVGATPILVLTGYGRGDWQYIGPEQHLQPALAAEDLPAAVRFIQQQLAERCQATG
ncbi:MAG: D-glycero-beta-D-manno-heptose-1,7-bisphosphate 7-phosphatase [Desulfobulbus propionicus]|nr:MAG: D-glycero-beta-D-manno-heptose-1,7-bisphosphate 7-phosphatase [Desulfobulbus propionicus]